MKLINIAFKTILVSAVAYMIYGCSLTDEQSEEVETTLEMGVEEVEIPKQFEKGVALLGLDVGSGTHFTQHLTPKMGAELTKTSYEHTNYDAMTPIWVKGKQYIMALSSKPTDKGYFYFIQRIFPSGDFGPTTDQGYFNNYYPTLISVTKPDGGAFIFGQKDGDYNKKNNRAFTQGVSSGGTLYANEAWHADWYHYYHTATPLPLTDDGRTCFFLHALHHNNPWLIECIDDKGKVYDRESGEWEHGWPNLVTYRELENTYLFGHRHYLPYDEPWFLQHIHDYNKIGNESDNGTWKEYYKTMTAFYSPEKEASYVIGHNESKHWFIQHVSHLGHMGEEIEHGGPWAHYYEHLFPVDFDTEYLKVDNWMERMFDEIPGFGDRKLSQIALPGSHDSGMNSDDRNNCYPSVGSGECNTIAHRKDIGGQLALGARYFDIRPKMSKDAPGYVWHTGHETNHQFNDFISKNDDMLGCLGESKGSIVESTYDFFDNGKHSKELVILSIPNCLTEPGDIYDTCSDSQAKEMIEDFAASLGDNLIKGDIDLRSATLNELLQKGNILLLADHSIVNTVGSFAKDLGIYKYKANNGKSDNGSYDFYIYNKYSDTESFHEMKNDQFDKLNEYGSDYFLFSWTLTLNEHDAKYCSVNGSSILKMADKTQPRIYEWLYVAVTDDLAINQKKFPNILYVDTFNRTTTNAAIYLNKIYNSLPSPQEPDTPDLTINNPSIAKSDDKNDLYSE